MVYVKKIIKKITKNTFIYFNFISPSKSLGMTHGSTVISKYHPENVKYAYR